MSKEYVQVFGIVLGVISFLLSMKVDSKPWFCFYSLLAAVCFASAIDLALY